MISDSAALSPLGRGQDAFGSSSSSPIDIHPALIRFSFKDIKPDRPVPTFVLPVGRVVKIFYPYGRRDLDIMTGVDRLLKDKNTASIKEFSLSAWRSIYDIASNTSAAPDHAVGTQAYIKEITTKLANDLWIAHLIKGQDLERLRCEAWRAVLRKPSSFWDTAYVAVVDTTDLDHLVWLIRRRNQQNEEGEWEYVSVNTFIPPPFDHGIRSKFDVAQIFLNFSEWIQRFYGETVYSFTPDIENTYIDRLLTAQFADAQQYEREKSSILC